ncbi:MAG: FHA domain-containing protein [Clostridium sp.]|uniref:FHA domain-containing protein n=1 Tax=Clostridium culturomicium TaxID=1499683 RepID=UPI00058B70D5|nr:FHA domain-containing protein [Clostridium culturomicium]MDU4891051.1 FHA domain-containing protein [Clostridium sp.]MDU7085566.1 FHA domain-containing protein [Clostridium sp.]
MEILKFGLKVGVIVLIYFIIFYALKIMYTDTKTSGKRRNKIKKATMGLEVIEAGENSNLKTGGVLPLADIITMGRKSDNTVILDDKYVSSHHMKIFKRNNEYVIEDLDSTNGTKVNDELIKNRVTLRAGDSIKVGTAIFKLI